MSWESLSFKSSLVSSIESAEGALVQALLFLVSPVGEKSGKGEEGDEGDGTGEEDESLQGKKGLGKSCQSGSKREEFSRSVEEVEKENGGEDFED
jgi:hypothetical protein